MRASLLISALGVGDGVGCKMAFGVSRRNVVRPLILGRLSRWAGSNKVARSWSQIIDWWTPAHAADWTSGSQAATAKAASPVLRSV